MRPQPDVQLALRRHPHRPRHWRLDDSVVDPNESLEHATGIKFYEPSARALSKAIRKSLVLYQDPDLLHHFRINAMAADFSWKRTATQYLDLYPRLLRRLP